MHAMVVQFGFAIIPFLGLMASSGLHSVTMRNVGVFTPCGGVVDHGGAGSNETGAFFLEAVAPAENGDVDAFQIVIRDGINVFYDDIFATEFQYLTGSGGKKEADLVARKVAFFQDGAHNLANLAGGANDGESEISRHIVSLILRQFPLSGRCQRRRLLLLRCRG